MPPAIQPQVPAEMPVDVFSPAVSPAASGPVVVINGALAVDDLGVVEKGALVDLGLGSVAIFGRGSAVVFGDGSVVVMNGALVVGDLDLVVNGALVDLGLGSVVVFGDGSAVVFGRGSVVIFGSGSDFLGHVSHVVVEEDDSANAGVAATSKNRKQETSKMTASGLIYWRNRRIAIVILF